MSRITLSIWRVSLYLEIMILEVLQKLHDPDNLGGALSQSVGVYPSHR